MKISKLVFSASIVAVIAIFSAGAQAQATRTWVSGVGDDVNPCSRTAPCKTFAGAISKTAAGGEIDALDPGGFGGVTITKSITINGQGTLASILVVGTNGITVSAAATDIVKIRNLSIIGAGSSNPGINGIAINTAGHVEVENCDFSHFSTSGINMATGAASRLSVINSQFFDVANAININPTAAATVTLNNISVQGSTNGLNVVANAIVSISNSVIAHNTAAGISTAGAVTVNAESVRIEYNDTGIVAAGTSTVRMSNLAILNNTTAGITRNGTTSILASFLNNKIRGNGSDGVPTVTLAQQ